MTFDMVSSPLTATRNGGGLNLTESSVKTILFSLRQIIKCNHDTSAFMLLRTQQSNLWTRVDEQAQDLRPLARVEAPEIG